MCYPCSQSKRRVGVELSRPSLPAVPEHVRLEARPFTNQQGLKLQTFRCSLRAPAKGVVWLCHGYSSHSIFEWFRCSVPGGAHDCWSGSFLAGLVDAGFMCGMVDMQSHGSSEGVRDLRCYFEEFDHLPRDCLACLSELLKEVELATLPVFVLGVSMGGAVAVRMAQMQPELFRGAVLLSPMLSLEKLKKQKLFGCVTNGDLEVFGKLLDAFVPTKAIGSIPQNDKFEILDVEMKNDPLCYSGGGRVRVGVAGSKICDWFMGGGLKLMTVPFITFHSVGDNLTDPEGSQRLLDVATATDKTFKRVGVGMDVDADMWHTLSMEPGYDLILRHVLKWILARTPEFLGRENQLN